MVDNKKHLGVEFYRNFVGIEKPLRVQDDKLQVYDFAHIDKNGNLLLEGDEWDYDANFIECKPYLRTIEDLSDEELLNIFIGSEVFKIPFIIIKRDEYSVNFFYHTTKNHVCGWNFNTGNLILKEFFDIQGIQNRLAEKHCHLRSKEYIDNGLALRVEK